MKTQIKIIRRKRIVNFACSTIISLTFILIDSNTVVAQAGNEEQKQGSKVFELLSGGDELLKRDSVQALYDRVLGSWTLQSTWYEKSGAKKEGKGEWHFSKVIGGQGVLDVLYRSGAAVTEYGVTLRCYDKSINA